MAGNGGQEGRESPIMITAQQPRSQSLGIGAFQNEAEANLLGRGIV